MIHYDSQFNEAIYALRAVFIDRHFDLLVRQLKLPALYFQEPGFIYYGHSIENSLQKIDSRYAILIRLFCLNQSVKADDTYRDLLPKPLIDQLVTLGLLIEQEGGLRTDYYSIVPFLGSYLIATMGTVRSIGAYLGRQSYILASSLFTHPFESFLDLGSGCGVLAILAA